MRTLFSGEIGSSRRDFAGTSREPLLIPELRSGELRLVPFYEQIDQTGLAFYQESADTVAEMGGPGIDLPISSLSYRIDYALIDLLMPLLPSDEEQPFRLKLALEGIATDDGIWNLFDPAARLSRDPIDMVIDAEGTAVLAEDIFTDDPDMPLTAANIRLQRGGKCAKPSAGCADLTRVNSTLL